MLGFICKTWKATNKKELMKLLDLEKRVERDTVVPARCCLSILISMREN